MHAGWAVPITVHALRRDGFNGSIEISLKDAPAGFTLNGGWIPAGKDSVRMTLTAPEQPSDSPVILQMEGHTVIDGNSIIRSAIPAEEMMQAFAYWHLVPAETLMADVMENKARIHFMVLGGNGPLDIPAGGAAQVRIQLSAPPRMQSVPLVLQLSEPPKGMSLDNVRIDTGNVMTFTLKADAKEINPGFADNLIVEVFINAVKIQKLTSIGILPAIPFEIVQGRNH
jgi:hypothetical protein